MARRGKAQAEAAPAAPAVPEAAAPAAPEPQAAASVAPEPEAAAGGALHNPEPLTLPPVAHVDLGEARLVRLVVTGPDRGAWCIGRKFTPTVQTFEPGDLTMDEIDAICADPALTVETVEIT